MDSSNRLHCIEIDPVGDHKASVIWLHGLGANGHDFEPVVAELGLVEKGVRFVLPHAPFRKITLNGGAMMPGWYDIYALDGSAGEDDAGIRDSGAQLDDLIQIEKDKGVPAEKIIIAGFSQGGAVALFSGLRHPERIGGIMALSTYLPLAPTTRDELHEASKGVNIFMAHGSEDPVILPNIAELSRQALEALGAEVEWHEYDMPHAVCPEEIGHIRDWLSRTLAV